MLKKTQLLLLTIVTLLVNLSCLANKLPSIYIIQTGGTIAGEAKSAVSSNYQAGVLSASELLKDVPQLNQLAKISAIDLMRIDSADITISDWLKLAKTVNEVLQKKEVNGVVITHGTDTMEETAYFLNLVVKSNKPVVLVGAMRPATSISADGPLNLYNAVAVATSPQAVGKGVLVVMNDQIFNARDVTKTNTTRSDTFRSLNTGPIGIVDFGSVHFYKNPLRQHTVNTPFDVTNLTVLPKVEIIYEYAGTDGQLFENAIANNSIKGVVFAGSGDGNIAAPERKLMQQARDKGMMIVRSSRTGSGYVTYDYVDSLDSKLGLVSADDLNPQKARILLMLALTKTQDPKVIKEYFATY